GDGRPLPAVGVDQEHAVAVAVDDLVPDVGLQVAHAADRHGTLDALVGGGDPERRRPAAGDAGHRQPVGVHVGPAHQAAEGADAGPALDAGRRVAGGLPPEASLEGILADGVVLVADTVGAVVDAGDLAELQRVDDQADVAVVGEPHAVVLEGGLVAVAALAGV